MAKFKIKTQLKTFSILILVFSLNINSAHSETQNADTEESLFFQYQKELLSDSKLPPTLQYSQEVNCAPNHDACLTNNEIAIQALDIITSDIQFKASDKIKKEIYRLRFHTRSLGELLQLYLILTQNMRTTDLSWESELLENVNKDLDDIYLSKKAVLVLQAAKNKLTSEAWNKVYNKLERLSIESPAPIAGPQSLIDLVNVEPELEKYKSGRYKNSPRIFMFCRSIRTYSCLMIMKNADGSLRKREDGITLWTQPSLGYSRHKKEYNEPSGNTPTGVLRIDGVMPDNDKQMSFGKYRRLILNFVASSEGEIDHKSLLPASSQTETWWQQAVVSRDIGRGMLRIHGTGLRSSSGSDYYPLVPTSGCIAKRENTYDNIKYTDQRELLDELMKASNLNPTFENEENIRALIYVVNIDGLKRNVTVDDLYRMGIVKR